MTKLREKKHPLKVTRFERLTDKLYRSHPIYEYSPVERKYIFQQRVDDTTGIVVRTSECVTVDRVKEMENYRVSDFSLENQLACGVSLSSCKLSSSVFEFLDRVPNV